MPSEAREELLAAGTVVDLPLATTVAHRDDPSVSVHFPFRGAISEIEEQSDGGSAEVTVVGPEGVSPIEALLDSLVEQRRRLVQVPCHGLAVDVHVARGVVERFPAARALVNRYAVATLRIAGIGIACNARHPAPARLARWLLRMHDRIGDDRFELTHEATAVMLAVRRPTVTLAISELVAIGAIASTRGLVRIVDREKLETITCRCYAEGCQAVDRLYA